jgi:NADPH-dependent stearoyl-CoA 9-desaturase
VSTLADEIHAMGRQARAAAGAEDVAHLKRMKASCRLAEVLGRLLLISGGGPVAWFFGTLFVAYQLSCEAQLNHSIMHGAFVGLPGAGRYVPWRYETLAIPFRSKTWRDAHRIHHANPSRLGADPDTVHPLFRMHAAQGFRVWHRLNAVIGWLFTFEHWAFDYDAFLKRHGHRENTDRSELPKVALYVLYQLVLWPALAGPRWLPVLLGCIAAIVIRNVVFTALQTGSSVGHEVSTRHARGAHDDWLVFQMETSKNFVLRGLLRVLCGGLDRHIEHHLWPHLPPLRLHALSPRVKQLCAQHGVRYAEFPSLRASLNDSVSYLHSLSRRPTI